MPIERHRRNRTEISLVPLINMIFLLIIFFLVAGTIKTPDLMQVEIPKASTGNMDDESGVVILLSQRGDIVLNNVVVSKQMLSSALGYHLRKDPHKPITVKADARMDAKDIISLMKEVTKAGGINLSIVTELP